MIRDLNNWFKHDLGHYTFPIGCNFVFELTIQNTYINSGKEINKYSLELVTITKNVGECFDRDIICKYTTLENALIAAKNKYIEILGIVYYEDIIINCGSPK